MDFLVLFILYIILVLLSILFCLFSGRKHSFPSRFVAWGSQVLLYLVPAQVLKALHRLFHTRSPLFMVLNFVLEVLVYVEYSWEVFGYCRELEFHLLVLLLPYLLLLVNLGFFLLCSKTDPGTITKSNQALFLHIYPYDGVMFKDTECPTCGMRKPARSKHCGVCNVCVHRFDHHCVWVNNCIGAFNMRYFVPYLFSLLAMATIITIITATFLIQAVVLSGMILGHYLDDRGQEHPVDVIFLIQHLFLTFPRIVFMLGFVVIISLILGSYFCFTLYLILTNQTSNEWFKAARYKCLCSEHCRRHRGYKNIYSRGVLGNIMETVRPLTSTGKKRG